METQTVQPSPTPVVSTPPRPPTLRLLNLILLLLALSLVALSAFLLLENRNLKEQLGITIKPYMPKSCEYEGMTYQPGESMPSIDNCNSCACDESGQVACTTMACENSVEQTQSDPTADWEEFRNTKYNYKINFPEELTFNQTGMGRYDATVSDSVAIYGPPTSKNLKNFIIEVESTDSNRANAKNIQEYMTWLRDNNTQHPSGESSLNSNLSEFRLEDLTGIEFSTSGTVVFTPSAEFGTDELLHKFVGFEKDGQLIIIYYPDIEPYNQILSTFKFTE